MHGSWTERVQGALGWAGLDELFARVSGSEGAIVLMYHSISGPEQEEWVAPRVRWPRESFELQVDFLKRRRRVISMDELSAILASGATPARGTVAITFDDGYLDTLRIAAPILDAAGLAATVYLPTRYVADARAQWVDELWTMLRTRRTNEARTERGNWTVSGRSSFEAAALEIGRHLLESLPADRDRILGQLRESLNPSETPPRLTMNWDEVRELIRRFKHITLGGHTMGHVDLKRWTGAEARAEVIGCATALWQETGVRAKHFSFPYGRSCEETRDIVKEAGFETAVAAGTGVLLNRHSDRWALPRVEGHAGLARLGFLTSGAYPRMPGVSRV